MIYKDSFYAPKVLIKRKDWFPKRMDLKSIQHATTFLQWYKGTCFIFQIKQSLHFTKWDPEGWHLVHWRSQHA